MNHDMLVADHIEDNRTRFDRMNLADYLIGNNDEYALNWGFLYDNDLNILGISPLMDFDHVFESSPASVCQPMRFLGWNTTQLGAAVDVVKRHPEWMDNEIDLSKYKYGYFVKERLEMLKKETERN